MTGKKRLCKLWKKVAVRVSQMAVKYGQESDLDELISDVADHPDDCEDCSILAAQLEEDVNQKTDLGNGARGALLVKGLVEVLLEDQAKSEGDDHV